MSLPDGKRQPYSSILMDMWPYHSTGLIRITRASIGASKSLITIPFRLLFPLYTCENQLVINLIRLGRAFFSFFFFHLLLWFCWPFSAHIAHLEMLFKTFPSLSADYEKHSLSWKLMTPQVVYGSWFPRPEFDGFSSKLVNVFLEKVLCNILRSLSKKTRHVEK